MEEGQESTEAEQKRDKAELRQNKVKRCEAEKLHEIEVKVK